MNKRSRSILVVCLVIVTVLSSGCGAVTAVPSPTGTPAPTRMATETITASLVTTSTQIATNTQKLPVTTVVPKYGWRIYFQYEFETGFWKSGLNYYRIIANCPDTEYFGDYDGSMTFLVDENDTMFSANTVIELYYFGMRAVADGYEYMRAVNPRQRTRIVFGYRDLSLEQVTEAINECQIRAIINRNVKVHLLPTEPTTDTVRPGTYFRQ